MDLSMKHIAASGRYPKGGGAKSRLCRQRVFGSVFRTTRAWNTARNASVPGYVVQDQFLPAVKLSSRTTKPVEEFGTLGIGALSLREEWNSLEAGSVGGWMREEECSRVYSLTSAHVLPNSVRNT